MEVKTNHGFLITAILCLPLGYAQKFEFSLTKTETGRTEVGVDKLEDVGNIRQGNETLTLQSNGTNLLQESFEKSTEVEKVLSRRKRFIFLNVFGTFDVGFLYVQPIQIVLPAMTNLFNSFRRRKKRSVTLYRNESHLAYNDYLPHPLERPYVEKLLTYFDLLEIPEHTCQLRAVCEFAAEPERFFPISDLVLAQVKKGSMPHIYVTQQASPEMEDGSSFHDAHSSKTKTVLGSFQEAYDVGEVLGIVECEEKYKFTCKYDMEKLLNMQVLRYWSLLAKWTRLKFIDENSYNVLQ